MSEFDRYARLPTDRMRLPPNDAEHPLTDKLKIWVRDDDFPCVGAKAALSQGEMTTIVLPDISLPGGDARLHAALLGFVSRARLKPALFQSFAVLFEAPDDLSEQEFETRLWERIQAISDRDFQIGHSWDHRVSSSPADPHFSLSFAGEAFFVVGLHPHASRPARRFDTPVLIFNMHAQFERLRAEGRYERLRETILQRDERLAGSVNPMLQRFGEASEARQYSGRTVTQDWRCPFNSIGMSAGHKGDGDVP